MKKTYTTPTLTTTGNVVGETLFGAKGGTENGIVRPTSSGSVGFYL